MKTNIDDLKNRELEKIKGGAGISIGVVCAVLSIAILSVFVWKFFTSEKGKATFPGGFSFEWGAFISPLLNLFKWV